MLLVVLGITFIYNPRTNTGFVYINNSPDNYIIIVDNDSNALRYYKGFVSGEERLDYGFDKWLRDKLDKGMPFKSVIIPYVPDARQQYDMQKKQQPWR